MSRDIHVLREFIVRCRCRDCGTILNTSVPMTKEKLDEAWMRLILSMPLVAGVCPNKCRSTFSDCNLNVKTEVVDAQTNEVFDLRGQHLSDLPTHRLEIV